MNILGIGGYSHDSAAALLCDGHLIAAVAEERLTRVKHQGGIPRRAVAHCLREAGLNLDDVDHVCGYMQPGKRLRKRAPYRLRQMVKSPLYSAAYIGYELGHNAGYAAGLRSMCSAGAELHFMAHHPAHAASAFLVSAFDEAALLTIDYVGEWAATWMGVGRGTSIESLHEINYPHSLGVLYSAVTDYLGFERASDEYKVMGLAAYGEPEFLDTFRAIAPSAGNGAYTLDLSWLTCHYRPGTKHGYFSEKFTRACGPPRGKDEPIEDRHKAIAASVQRVLEEHVLRMANSLHQKTGMTNLCLAGGVALNCAMNGRLLRESPFEEIFIQPASGDDGIAIGAAFQQWHKRSGQPRAFEMTHAYWGPDYADEILEGTVRASGLPYRYTTSIEDETAKLLAEGKVVGWFQGRMEFGPRALGARSILADPTRPEMRDRVNRLVKHREDFRPFAPACLEDRAGEFFDGCTKAPFMLVVYPVRGAQRKRLPAITHVDGTARVQTVSRETNPRFYDLIQAFDALQGVPAVLNTSFNVMGEPIVNTPDEALRCFAGTGLDALAIGDYLVTKP